MNPVHFPDPPLVPGLSLRPYMGESDLPGLFALHQAVAAHDRLDPLSPALRPPTFDDLATVYAPRSDFDPEQQVLVAQVDEHIAAYAWFRVWAEGDTWVLNHRVHLSPQWAGQGIGRWLLIWAETMLAYIADHRPPQVAAVYRTTVPASETGTVARLQAVGYGVVQQMDELRRDDLSSLPPAAAPSEVVIRSLHSHEYRAAFNILATAFADDPARSSSADDFDALMTLPATDPGLWRAAFTGDEVIGLVLAEHHPPAGLVAELGVLPAWRRRGLGRALLLAALGALRERNIQMVYVYTDARDLLGARTLYLSAGFTIRQSVLRYEKYPSV